MATTSSLGSLGWLGLVEEEGVAGWAAGSVWLGWGRAAGGRRGDLALQVIDLLLGDLIAGIDFERALELNESSVEIAALDEDAAAVDVSGRGLESHAREVLFVTQVVRPQIDGVLVVGKGGVVILVRFGGLPAFVPRF